MVNPILFGKYHLIEKISAGGMAEVYKAKSYGVAGFEKILVIKKILPHLNSDKEFVDMFQDEAKICGQLSHGNIVQVIDCGKESDSFFMAMEFVNGYDLSRVLLKSKQGEELSQPLCLFILGDVLKALDYAHRRRDREQRDLNIVHCDVSPQNVLLSFEGEVKLTDFGISKAAFQSASSQGVVRGKYAYMSPEQVEGRPLDRRSDIFSVGIILWELLTGKRLFKTDSVEKTLRRVMSATIPPPSSLMTGIHPELDRITLKALSRDRETRYSDDQEMLDDLSTFMFSQGMQITAADLADYLRRLFSKELQKAREDDMGFGMAGATDEDRKRRRTMFIPVGSGRSIACFQPDQETAPGASLTRVGVAVLCAEWNLSSDPNRTSSEESRLTRSLMERFEARIESTGGELWEVNHNSLVACWRVSEDPAGSMTLAAECAFGLREEVATTFGAGDKACTLGIALHAGAVVLERRSGNPLYGWQLTRTFALPRLMLNLNGGADLVLMSERGKQLAEERFTFKGRKLEGRADSYLPDLFEVTGLTGARGKPGPKYSPFTRYLGRESVLASMVDRLREASDGKASAVLLLGDEGMGRSRLREEFRLACRKLGASFFIGAAQKELKHAAYAPLLDALRRICGIIPPESVDSERQKLSRLIELGLSQEELELVQSLYDEPVVLFGRALDSSRKGRIFALFDKILAGLTKDAPLVLAFEDLHWADSLTEEYIAELCSKLRSRRLVLVLEAPSDFTRPWLKNVPATTHRFEPMPEPLAEEMIKDMLGVLEVNPDLLQSVVARTGGNPLHIKELVGLMVEEEHIRIERRIAHLVQQPPGRSALPGNEKELLARRFARVSDDIRPLLKAGAVIGPQFPLVVLERLYPEGAAVARDLLQKAVALGVLKERQSGNATWFRFRHSYYRTLSAGLPTGLPAMELYRRLADGLRAWGDFGRGNVLERVAQSSWIGQAVDAATALERAGDKLFYEHGFASSLKYYRRALELIKGRAAGNDAHRRRIRWRIAGTLLHQGAMSENDQLLQDALASARKAGVESEASELLVDLSEQHMTRGEADRAIQVLRLALAMAHRGASSSRIAEIERELGRALRIKGELDEALHYLRAGYQRAKGEGDRSVILAHAQEIGAFYHQVGDYQRALDSFRRVLIASRDLDQPALTVQVLISLGELHRDAHREELSLRCYREALSRARAMEDQVAQSAIMGDIGIVALEGGAPQRAYPYLKAALEQSTSLNRSELVTAQRLSLAYLRGVTGDPRQGLREIQTVMARPETGQLRLVVARAHLLTGRLQLKMRETRRAREAFERCLNVARELSHAPLTRLAMAALAQTGTSLNVPVRGAPTLESL